MADRSGFDEFVATRSPALLRTAYLLTGDHGLAEDLLQTALAKCWFRSARGVFVMATCVRGVRLRLTLAGRDAGELTCDDSSATLFGLVNYPIRDPVVAGLRPGQRITLQVRPVESRNGQWAILQVG